MGSNSSKEHCINPWSCLCPPVMQVKQVKLGTRYLESFEAWRWVLDFENGSVAAWNCLCVCLCDILILIFILNNTHPHTCTICVHTPLTTRLWAIYRITKTQASLHDAADHHAPPLSTSHRQPLHEWQLLPPLPHCAPRWHQGVCSRGPHHVWKLH